jgi:hypothetical protein
VAQIAIPYAIIIGLDGWLLMFNIEQIDIQ